jgi:di/tricarboxylate transporter
MSDQSIVFLLISTTLVLFIWGRVRYDLVAFMALIAGTIVGVIPTMAFFPALVTLPL